jgi:hypothetical protein
MLSIPKTVERKRKRRITHYKRAEAKIRPKS